MTGQGEWHVRAPAAGGTFQLMMVKEHEPFLDGMPASITAARAPRAAA